MAVMSGGASRTICPHLAPWWEGPLMWLHMECCCSFLSATKATCFYFLRLRSLFLWTIKEHGEVCNVWNEWHERQPAKHKLERTLPTRHWAKCIVLSCIMYLYSSGLKETKCISHPCCLCPYNTTAHTHSSVALCKHIQIHDMYTFSTL